MKFKSFKDNIDLSLLGMGNMRLPVINGKDSDIDFEKAKEIIDYAYKSGINYFDTAFVYHEGQSEVFLGKALKEYPRDSFYVADKFNLQAEPDFEKQFALQLQRLDMDRIDFYLLHAIQDSFYEEMLSCGAIEFFDKMKKEGKIKYLGFSFHGSADKLPIILEKYDWDFVQIQLNYYDWYFGSAKKEYEILESRNIPVIVMEPVHGGMLANLKEEAANILKSASPEKSLARWALEFVASKSAVQVILSGMSTLDQIKDNVKTFSEISPLNTDELALIEKAAKIQHSALSVACTECRYCTPNCPQGLDIPFLLKNYNSAKIDGTWRLAGLLKEDESVLPSSCIECENCVGHCPQSFNIPAYLKELDEMIQKLREG